MYILDGKAFAALQESGQHNSEAAVDECMLLANNQVIFAAGIKHIDGCMLTPFHRSRTLLGGPMTKEACTLV